MSERDVQDDLGYSQREGLTRFADWTERIHPADVADTMQAFERARQQRAQFRHEHRILRAQDGEERWVAATGLFHPDESGQPNRFIGVMLDVTERRRADQERNELLRRESEARLAAEDAARLKDQFLATLSHELLDISRIITGQLRIEREPILLATVLGAAIDTVRPQAAARQITIALEAPHEDVAISGDPSRLQQVFTNLLINAIKFSPAGSGIEVALHAEVDRAEITFTDHGEGISADMPPVIFERFRQADGSTRTHGGMGLGLAIARHLLDMHADPSSRRARARATGRPSPSRCRATSRTRRASRHRRMRKPRRRPIRCEACTYSPSMMIGMQSRCSRRCWSSAERP